MENFKNFKLSDDAKLEIEKYFRTNFLNPSDVFKTLCDAQEKILLVQQQKENTINIDSVVEILGLYIGRIEVCLVDD